MNSMKWTQEIREYVFSTLIDYFGPYSEWKYKSKPGDGNIPYIEVMKTLSNGIKEYWGYTVKPRAIENQINLLIAPGGMIKTCPQASMRCIVAALETGFVKPSDIKGMGYRLTLKEEDMSQEYHDKFNHVEEVKCEYIIEE